MENNINENLFRMVCNQFNSIIALTSIANRNIKMACTPISMQKLPNKIILFFFTFNARFFFSFCRIYNNNNSNKVDGNDEIKCVCVYVSEE